MTTLACTTVALAGGRTLDVLTGGAPSGPALICHHGTPSDASTWETWSATAAGHGLRLVAISRPGYAGSTRFSGRAVADVAGDVRAVIEHLAIPWFVTAGWSGGGPHALATAALVPGARAVATLAGVGPYDAGGLDFLAGMGPENHAEFGAALAGEAALRAWLEANAADMRTVTAQSIIDAFGGLVPEVDRATLRDGMAEGMAATCRRALAPGFDGWIDDDLAFAKPWGVEVERIAVPATIWQGDLDLMVPFAHGVWLAAHVPGAQARLVPGHGHLSLVAALRDDIVADLVARAAGAG